MLQNRVNPFGDLIKNKARGAWLGNRGVIHNEQKEIVRPFKTKAWITCMLYFRGRHREIMQPGRWTELFFLDEATAFAAGHRPCFQCRYKDHMRFKEYWLKGNPGYGFNMQTPVAKIDDIIHKQRIAKDGTKITYQAAIKELPGGTFIMYNNLPYVVYNNKMHAWQPEGYATAVALPGIQKVAVLTPHSFVNMLSAGYTVQVGISM